MSPEPRRYPGRFLVRDDRGRIVPVYRLNQRWWRPSLAPELPEAVFERIRAHLLGTGQRGMGAPPWVLWALVVFYGAMMGFVWWRSRSGFVAWVVIGLVGVFAMSALTYRRRVPDLGGEALANALLLEHRCPSCAYDLTAAPRDAHGLSICSECGAAWFVHLADTIPRRDADSAEGRPI